MMNMIIVAQRFIPTIVQTLSFAFVLPVMELMAVKSDVCLAKQMLRNRLS